MARPDQATQGGLAFATPGDWFAIRLPRERVDADQLADELATALQKPAGSRDATGSPDASPSRDGLRTLIRDLVEASAALDVVCAYATVLDVPGGPLPATLVASVRSMGEYSLDQIASEMSGADGAVKAPLVDMLDLPAGRTVRIERLREMPGTADGRRPVSFIVQYIAEGPGSGQAVLLTFSTPAVALADQLRQLFHQIACTLRFDGADPQP
jgi:hypothetical protein